MEAIGALPVAARKRVVRSSRRNTVPLAPTFFMRVGALSASNRLLDKTRNSVLESAGVGADC
jgi:hypothetical protein